MIKRIKESRALLIISIAIIIVITLLIGNITYAYFIAQYDSNAKTQANLGAGTLDELKLIKGDALNLAITPSLLQENSGNLTVTSNPQVSLLANNSLNSAQYSYNLYLNVYNNNFVYTTPSNSPEIILTIIDPNDNLVTSIDGLTYLTFGGVSGFDITTYNGLIPLTLDYSIEANSIVTTIQEWQLKLTYINMATDQSANLNNSLNTEVIMERVGFDFSTICTNELLSDCLIENYSSSSNIYYHDVNLANSASDQSYRYSGINPNNYICFGSDAVTCPVENLYRIIGIFDEGIKIIKAKEATTGQLGTDGAYSNSTNNYYWDASSPYEGVWANSELNTINLNTNYISYLNSIDTKWDDMIVKVPWKVSGIYDVSAYNAPSVYSFELGEDRSGTTTYYDKIGLMYVSDYMYAVSPQYWTYSLFNFEDPLVNDYGILTSLNWMHANINEWMITPCLDYDDDVFVINAISVGGDHDFGNGLGVKSNASVRPTFYLDSSAVVLVSGNGTYFSPFRIA